MSGDQQGLEQLPTKVLEHLVELLDYSSRRTCRLVSKIVKRYVDQTGLSVKIDTRKAASSCLFQSVTVTEAVIIHLETLDWSQKYLENWKTVILSGYINPNWFTNGLQRNCTNLRVLIIHEKCITCQDFIQTTKALPIFNHLTQLQIFLSQPNFVQSIAKNNGRILIPGSKKKFMDNSWKKIDKRIHKNMIYLLQTIRSRVLKVLHVTAFTVDPANKKPKICWEHEHLFEFIHIHKSTLEEVVVPNLHFGETDIEDAVYEMPSKVQTLVLTMPTILTYWRSFLLNQDSLQNLMLHVGLESRPVIIFYFILLNSVVSNNSRTLVRIRLAFSNPVRLNLKMFQLCQSLQYFSVEALAEVDILNLNQLPLKCLNCLELVKKVNIPADFNAVQFFKDCHHPKHLRFMGLSDDNPLFTDPKYMLTLMKLVLRCRTLNAISMVMKKYATKATTCHVTDPTGLFQFLEKATPKCYQSLDIWDILNMKKEVKNKLGSTEGFEYVLDEGAINLNYLEAVACVWILPSREQPLNFPRNAESYIFLKNQKTGAIKIEAQSQPYHERVSDLGLIRVLIDEIDPSTGFRVP